MTNKIDLGGRNAIVTGGAQGIGRAIVERFLDSGAAIAIWDRDTELAKKTAAELKNRGRVAPVAVDVTNYADVERARDETVKALGRIDILVNNAGITRDGLLMKMKDEQWDEVLDTNLKGVFLCTKAVSRGMMKQRWGRIINITSVVGFAGNAGQANYAASKAGVMGLTKSVAKEAASRGITVNAVAPGFIDTEMTATLPEKVREAFLQQIPLGRMGKPEDVAEAVFWLCSDASGYVTGQVIHVNGGMYM